jgi:predicted transcriptional regulator of viral defense system
MDLLKVGKVIRNLDAGMRGALISSDDLYASIKALRDAVAFLDALRYSGLARYVLTAEDLRGYLRKLEGLLL